MDVKIDLIIPIYNSGEEDSEYRKRNLNIILHMIPKMCNLILVEQYSGREFMTDDLIIPPNKNINLIKTKKNDIPFCKGWLYNIGVKNSKTNNIILGETDVFFVPLYFNFIYESIWNVSTWFFCYDNWVFLTEDGNIEKQCQPNPGKNEGGLVYFNKNFFYNIGGANELLYELGGIDNEICRRASFISNSYSTLQNKIYHMWHPKNKMKKDNWRLSTHRIENIKIYNMVKKDPQKYIDIFRKKEIGGDVPYTI